MSIDKLDATNVCENKHFSRPKARSHAPDDAIYTSFTTEAPKDQFFTLAIKLTPDTGAKLHSRVSIPYICDTVNKNSTKTTD